MRYEANPNLTFHYLHHENEGLYALIMHDKSNGESTTLAIEAGIEAAEFEGIAYLRYGSLKAWTQAKEAGKVPIRKTSKSLAEAQFA